MKRLLLPAGTALAAFLILPLPTPAPLAARSAWGSLPLAFEANLGQASPEVRFLARGPGYSLLLSAREAVVDSPQGPARIRFGSGRPPAAIEGQARLPGASNYLIGNDPSKWKTGVPSYARVRYREVYAGIDLVFYGEHGRLEYDFIVAPGADPSAIRLSFDGADKIELTPAGDLRVSLHNGELLQRRPVVYQESAGVRSPVEGRFRLFGAAEVGFSLAAYDARRPLVIDPTLSYATYLGGSGDDIPFDMAVDSAGNVYVAGGTASLNFPLASPLSGTNRGGDIFVAKINPAGSALGYSTYIGGGAQDTARAIALDSAGNVYLTGETLSSDFPVQAPFQRASGGGGRDAFVLKLGPAGDRLVCSTYLGGSGSEYGMAIATDSAGAAYVAGYTDSTNFPTRNPIQSANAGSQDAFVAKLAADGSSLVYSTYLGGSSADQARGIAVDSSGSAYVAGLTGSNAFPVASAYQRTRSGGYDAFVTRLNPAGSAVVYSTYLGGRGNDQANRVALDPAGNIYLAGTTQSTDFPVANAAQSELSGGEGDDAFVAKLSADGATLVYSIYLGGVDAEAANGLAVDAAGNAWVTGFTESDRFPILGALQGPRGRDAFVTEFSPQGKIAFSTFYGGANSESGYAIALDGVGGVYVAGTTDSTDLPLAGALQSRFAGGAHDAFVLKLTPEGSVLSMVSAASFSGNYLAPEEIVAAYGAQLAPGIEVAASASLPEELSGVSVLVKDSGGVERRAQLFFISTGQVNFVMPAGTADGVAVVRVLNGDRVVSAGTAAIERVAPGLFTANSNGLGVAAAVALRVRADGSQTSDLVFQCPAAGACVPTPIDLGPATDQVILLLFGTGIRGHGGSVRATVGGEPAEVLGAVPQGQYAGLDQVNVRLSRALIGRGDVNVDVTAAQRITNTVTVRIGGTPPVPRIDALSPTGGEQGRTVFLTIAGQNLAGVTAVEFSPPDGITLGSLGASSTSVELTAAISTTAAPGIRQVTVVSPGGRSNPLQFLVSAPAPPVLPARLAAVSPQVARQGETVDTLTLTGQNLAPVAALEISPPAGITISEVRASAGQVTARLVVDAGATAGVRTLAAVTPAGRTNSVQFMVAPPLAPPGPPTVYSTNRRTFGPSETVANWTIFGVNLAGVTAIEFSRPADYTVSNLRATANMVTATLTVNSTGGALFETFSLVSPAGKSASCLFDVVSGGGAGSFVLSNLRVGAVTTTTSGSKIPITVDFEDPAGIASTDKLQVNYFIGNGAIFGFAFSAEQLSITGSRTKGTLQFTLPQSPRFLSGLTLLLDITLNNARGIESNPVVAELRTP